jgi:hypothetical protein
MLGDDLDHETPRCATPAAWNRIGSLGASISAPTGPGTPLDAMELRATAEFRTRRLGTGRTRPREVTLLRLLRAPLFSALLDLSPLGQSALASLRFASSPSASTTEADRQSEYCEERTSAPRAHRASARSALRGPQRVRPMAARVQPWLPTCWMMPTSGMKSATTMKPTMSPMPTMSKGSRRLDILSTATSTSLS